MKTYKLTIHREIKEPYWQNPKSIITRTSDDTYVLKKKCDMAKLILDETDAPINGIDWTYYPNDEKIVKRVNQYYDRREKMYISLMNFLNADVVGSSLIVELNKGNDTLSVSDDEDDVSVMKRTKYGLSYMKLEINDDKE